MVQSWRKYWKTAAMEATSFLGDSPIFVLDYLWRFLRVAVLLALWRTILTPQRVYSGMTIQSVLTYTLIAEVFAEQLTPRTDFTWELHYGTITTRFLQPIGLVGQFTSQSFGRWLLGFGLFSIPLLLGAPLLGVNPLPANLIAGLLFLPSLLLAISVGLAIDFTFGALMVYFEQNVYGVDRLRTAASTLLSGALLPLALYPWGIGGVFAWLPFASMASAPLQIYPGTGNPVRLLLLQAGWSVLLWPLARWLERVHRERLVSFGG